MVYSPIHEVLNYFQSNEEFAYEKFDNIEGLIRSHQSKKYGIPRKAEFIKCLTISMG